MLAGPHQHAMPPAGPPPGIPPSPGMAPPHMMNAPGMNAFRCASALYMRMRRYWNNAAYACSIETCTNWRERSTQHLVLEAIIPFNPCGMLHLCRHGQSQLCVTRINFRHRFCAVNLHSMVVCQCNTCLHVAAVGQIQWGPPLEDPQQEAGVQAPDPPQLNPAGDRVGQWAEAGVEALKAEVGPRVGVGVGVRLHLLGVGAGLFHPPWYDYEHVCVCAFVYSTWHSCHWNMFATLAVVGLWSPPPPHPSPPPPAFIPLPFILAKSC